MKDCESDDDSIEVTKVTTVLREPKKVISVDHDLNLKKPSAKDQSACIKVKHEPINSLNRIDNQIKRMHIRVMRKARSKLTHAIKRTLETESEIAKAKACALKNTVRMIQKSETDNTNLDIIKSVTCDGEDLEYDGLDTIDSNEILNRVTLFHKLEEE